jgi:hypothetical protein
VLLQKLQHKETHSVNEPSGFMKLTVISFGIKNGKFKIIVKKVPVKAFGSYLSDFQNINF